MKAIVLSRYGGPEMLELIDVDAPVPGPDDILVDVHHSALNRADVLQRMGLYPDPRRPAVEIPGLEYAGVVAATGGRVTERAVGDEVMGIESGGCHAEQLVTNARQALPVPDGIAMVDAAAIPEVFMTAWDALVVQGGLTSGRWALVHAGASGVGTAAIQLAKAIGAHIAVTCSSGKADACRALGADVAINYRNGDWLVAAKEATGARGADVILDMVGGDYIEKNLRALALEGRLVIIAFLQGSKVTADWRFVMMKRLTITGSTMRASPAQRKADIARALRERVWPLFASGRLKPVIYRVFPLAEAAAAHALMESSQHIGKIMLAVRTE